MIGLIIIAVAALAYYIAGFEVIIPDKYDEDKAWYFYTECLSFYTEKGYVDIKDIEDQDDGSDI